MNLHRWNGWPGAVCMDCGTEDAREACLALGCYEQVLCSCADGCRLCCGTGVLQVILCPEHEALANLECPNPRKETS